MNLKANMTTNNGKNYCIFILCNAYTNYYVYVHDKGIMSVNDESVYTGNICYHIHKFVKGIISVMYVMSRYSCHVSYIHQPSYV